MVAPEPSWARVLTVCAGVGLLCSPLVILARRSAGAWDSAAGLVTALVAAPLLVLLAGSIGEWLVHRYLMHRRWRPAILRTIFELHHRGHHQVHFTPERYVHAGPINYVPVYPPRPSALCESRASRVLSMLAQLALYLSVAALGVFLPVWLLTDNPLFTGVVVLCGTLLCYLFVRVHDLVHYPGHSWLERLPGFAALDRHHYLHHIDTAANTNFLLPLGDLLMGTLRRRVTAREAARWPTYAAARERLVSPDEAASHSRRAA